MNKGVHAVAVVAGSTWRHGTVNAVPVVSDKLVYLELQKTACTTIGAILEDLFDAEHVAPKHGTLPDPATTKVVVGSVRNPWDYYLSLWAFGCQGRGNFHRVVTNHHWPAVGAHRFAPGRVLAELTRPVGRWRALYAEPHTAERFRAWLVRVHTPSHGGEFEPEYGSSALCRFAGYATYRYCRLYSGDLAGVLGSRSPAELSASVEGSYLPRAVIRMEHLADDLLTAVRTAGYEVGDELEHAVRERATTRTNVSSHGSYTDYYDDSTRDLVERRDQLVVARHGYRFGA